MVNTRNKIKKRILGNGRGWVFSPSSFYDIASRENVAITLHRLVDEEVIRHLALGLYDYPRKHPKLGLLFPAPEAVAKALVGKNNIKIQPSGAYAANVLGLSTQVPAKIVFLTDGPEKTVTIGKQQIILKKTTPKNMATAGKPSGLVIQALRFVGKDHVDEKVIKQLRTVLSKQDRLSLVNDIRFAPIWIGKIFRQLGLDG